MSFPNTYHHATQSQNPDAPPAPPPKPNTTYYDQDASGTLLSQNQSRLSQSSPSPSSRPHERPTPVDLEPDQTPSSYAQDPGDKWLPKLLEHKSKQDLTQVISSPPLIAALVDSTLTAHPSTSVAQAPIKRALSANIELAMHLNDVEAHLGHLRASTQARLMTAHGLERQWRQKQTEMDRALAPSAPSSLYQRLAQSVVEQESISRALEDSFLGDGGGPATEREVMDWVRRYRDTKKIYYSRREAKDRWDEGRVGGWR